MESPTPQTLANSTNADLNRVRPAEVNVPMNARPSLVFPISGYVGVLAEIAEAYSQRYESPKEFVYLDLLTIVGLILSGRVRADFGELKFQPRLRAVVPPGPANSADRGEYSSGLQTQRWRRPERVSLLPVT